VPARRPERRPGARPVDWPSRGHRYVVREAEPRSRQLVRWPSHAWANVSSRWVRQAIEPTCAPRRPIATSVAVGFGVAPRPAPTWSASDPAMNRSRPRHRRPSPGRPVAIHARKGLSWSRAPRLVPGNLSRMQTEGHGDRCLMRGSTPRARVVGLSEQSVAVVTIRSTPDASR
jgi:hypothetical protein